MGKSVGGGSHQLKTLILLVSVWLIQGACTNAALFKPPSNRVNFPPLHGRLLPPTLSQHPATVHAPWSLGGGGVS